MADGPTRALVLSGGGARGAYEAGVLRYILDAVPEDLGHPVNFDIVCGTSVGAINTAWLASTLNDPQYCGRRMWYLWRTLDFADIVRPSFHEIWRLLRQLIDHRFLDALDVEPEEGRRGGLLETSFFERLVHDEIPFHNISRNLRRGVLDAVTVSTTDIVSGRTTIFAQTSSGELPPWTRDPRRVAVSGPMTAQKVLASAAIPILFPAVQIGSRWFCDGGLRQNTPLAPALRLGADRVLVVTLHSQSPLPEPNPDPFDDLLPGHVDQHPSHLFVIGKLLDALLLDPLDYDLMVLERINALLRGAEAHVEQRETGDDNGIEALNDMMRAYRGIGYRIVEPQLLRPSRDLGQMAAQFASSVDEDFWGSRAIARLVDNAFDPKEYGENDLLSYLLFDGGYTGQLLDLGYRDAKAQHDELVDFFRD
jgi:NTE family protein